MSDMDIDRHLRCKIADLTEECKTLRNQLAHWKTFAVHAEGEHAAWKKTATELDEELRALKAAAVDGRTYTQADLMEAVKTERHACSICVWMVLQDALEPGADDKGLDGWMREAEQRVKNRLAHHGTDAAAPLPPVDGDILPAVGSKVLIHLASQDAWVEHAVAGYYVWPNHGLAPRVFRVFVRVRDADGYLNARSLEDIRYPDSATQHQSDAPVCPWCDRQGHDICQHAADARTCEAVR